MLSDETAMIFSSTFYHALIAGNHTVKMAFDIAVSAFNNEKPNAAETFLLLPKGEFGDINAQQFVKYYLRHMISIFRVNSTRGNPKLIP